MLDERFGVSSNFMAGAVDSKAAMRFRNDDSRVMLCKRLLYTCWPPLMWISAPLTYELVSVHST